MCQSSPRALARIGARLGLAVLVVAGLIGVAVPAQAGVSLTAFTVDSEAGDVIGGGQSFTFTSNDATITATGDNTALTMTVDDGGTHAFSADLVAPTGGALTTGMTYTTTKTGDASNAGLDVSGDGTAAARRRGR
jgi:hypothetical protein